MSLRDAVRARIEGGRPERAWDLAARVFADGVPRARHDARRLLLGLADRVPADAWTDQRAKAARLAGVVRASRPVVGEVAFPAVHPTSERFVIARVRLVGGDDVVPLLDVDTRGAIVVALRAARELLGYDGGFAVDLDFTEFIGESCGLAVALAAISAARRLPIDRVVATGALLADGRVARVGFLARKAALRAEARPRARMLVPVDGALDHPSLVPVGSLREAVEHLDPGLVHDLDEELAVVRRLDRQGDWLEAARRGAVLLDRVGLVDEERVELLVFLLSAANHRADDADRARWDARLRDLLEAAVDELVLARAIASRAVGAIDRFDISGAREVLSLADERPWRDEARVHLDGPRALLATLCGDLEGALALRRESLARAPAPERARCGGDLADALWRLGRAQQALDVVEAAIDDADVPRRRVYQLRTLAYLGLHHARALQALGRDDDARAALDAIGPVSGVDPAVRVGLLRAELERSPALVDETWAALPPWAAEDSLLDALRLRTRARLGDAAAAERLLQIPAFADLELDEAARRLPY